MTNNVSVGNWDGLHNFVTALVEYWMYIAQFEQFIFDQSSDFSFCFLYRQFAATFDSQVKFTITFGNRFTSWHICASYR